MDDMINSNLVIEVKPVDYYNDFSNTDNLPITAIINTIEEEYPIFLSDPNNKNILLTTIFDFNYKGFLFSSKGKFNGINIKNKTTFSLEKLITYLIYTKSSFLLEEKNGFFIFNIAGLKSQVGKDISRVNVLINNQKQNFASFLHGGNPDTPENNFIQEDNKISKITTPLLDEINSKEIGSDEITDTYNEILIKVDPGKIADGLKMINYNIINQIDILSCQSIFNFIAELIQIQIKNIAEPTLKYNYLLISPTSREDSNGKPTIANDKEIRIILDQQMKMVTIYFDSYLFTSSDFIAVGRVTFELSLDLMNNLFQFDTLNIEYNLEAYKPKYTMAQTAKYYGITKPTKYIQKRITGKGGKNTRKKGKNTKKMVKNTKKMVKNTKKKGKNKNLKFISY
jgi:hypothetical protein